MTGTLQKQTWMEDRAVKAVLDALGAPQTDVRFVGGCVRDAVMSRPVNDIDMATPDVPEVIVEKLSAAGLKAVPTGLAHGTVTAVADGQPFEVTTLRKDTACDGRHAAVEFTTDWQEDASRRDFSFNAMSLRPDGTLFDPFGGVADAGAGRVKFVGDPRDRIQEDYLRILRYFRFFALYGEGPSDPDILEACRDLRGGLAALSVERVRDEVVKMLGVPDPAPAVSAMAEIGILAEVLAEENDLGPLRRLIEVERGLGVVVTPSAWRRRWVALTGQGAEDAARRLKFSGRDVTYVTRLIAAADSARTAFDPISLNRFLHAFVNDEGEDGLARDGILIACARAGGELSADWRNVLSKTEQWQPRRFPLGGADVKKLGIAEGPKIGELLSALERDWVDGGFTASPDTLRASLLTLAQKEDPTS